MKSVKGYVFLAKLRDSEREFLFGRKSDADLSDRLYGDFESNGFLSYRFMKDVRSGIENYISQNVNIVNVDLARIRLKIAESEDELFYFANRSDLIAIMYGSSSVISNNIMYGDIVIDRPNSLPLPGAELYDNGYTTFRKIDGKHPFTLADSLCSKIARQAQSKATIAQFKLNRIENVFRNT